MQPPLLGSTKTLILKKSYPQLISYLLKLLYINLSNPNTMCQGIEHWTSQSLAGQICGITHPRSNPSASEEELAGSFPFFFFFLFCFVLVFFFFHLCTYCIYAEMLKLSEMGCLPYAQQRSPITISRRACAQWIQHRDVGVTATLKLSTAEEIEGQAVELLLDNDQDSSARRRYPDRSVRHRVAPHLRSQLCSQRHRNAALQ